MCVYIEHATGINNTKVKNPENQLAQSEVSAAHACPSSG
jgi:hypothetical protein